MSEPAAPVALLTGAARRVGAVLADTLHAAGWSVAIHARQSRAEAAALCATLERRRPGSTLQLGGDLADIGVVQSLVSGTLERFGRLDALVNNASSFHPTPIGTATEADWDDLFASNAKAPFFLAQAAAPALRAQRGAIINITDIYAERPLANHTIYVMAKAALRMMTLSLARDLAPEIRVNAIAPGAILWPESGKPYTDQQALIARTPLQRAGEPADIARALMYLLRDAPFVTGEILKVDGGRSLVI